MNDECLRCRIRISGTPPAAAQSPEDAAHLAACAECRRWAEHDSAIWHALGDLDVPVLPASLPGRIIEHARPRPALFLRRFLLGLASAAALAAGIFWGAWVGRTLSTGAPTTASPEAIEVAYAELFDVAPPGSLEAPASLSGGRMP